MAKLWLAPYTLTNTNTSQNTIVNLDTYHIKAEKRLEIKNPTKIHAHASSSYRVVANSSLSICRKPAIVKAPFSFGDVVAESPFVFFSISLV